MELKNDCKSVYTSTYLNVNIADFKTDQSAIQLKAIILINDDSYSIRPLTIK